MAHSVLFFELTCSVIACAYPRAMMMMMIGIVCSDIYLVSQGYDDDDDDDGDVFAVI